MKTLLITILVCSSITSAYSQIQAKKKMIEGHFHYSVDTEDRDKVGTELTEKTLIFNPKIGYFINNNTAFGIGILIQNEKQDLTVNAAYDYYGNRNAYDIISNLYMINPFCKKYTEISNNFYFTSTYDFLYGKGEARDASSSKKIYNTTIVSLGLTPGFTYLINERFAVNLALGSIAYSKKEIKDADRDSLPSESAVYDRIQQNVTFNFNTQSILLGVTFLY